MKTKTVSEGIFHGLDLAKHEILQALASKMPSACDTTLDATAKKDRMKEIHIHAELAFSSIETMLAQYAKIYRP